jgi:chromosome segregation ATPase
MPEETVCGILRFAAHCFPFALDTSREFERCKQQLESAYEASTHELNDHLMELEKARTEIAKLSAKLAQKQNESVRCKASAQKTKVSQEDFLSQAQKLEGDLIRVSEEFESYTQQSDSAHEASVLWMNDISAELEAGPKEVSMLTAKLAQMNDESRGYKESAEKAKAALDQMQSQTQEVRACLVTAFEVFEAYKQHAESAHESQMEELDNKAAELEKVQTQRDEALKREEELMRERDGERSCVVCLDSSVELVHFAPCFHECMCAPCVARLQSRQCPLCRAAIEHHGSKRDLTSWCKELREELEHAKFAARASSNCWAEECKYLCWKLAFVSDERDEVKCKLAELARDLETATRNRENLDMRDQLRDANMRAWPTDTEGEDAAKRGRDAALNHDGGLHHLECITPADSTIADPPRWWIPARRALRAPTTV